jgi:radical SAM-linked protein
MVRDKVRIRFRKSGALRLISHHDLMRTLERMLRRAALPYHSTAGFNPKPRLIIAFPLPLGVIGCQEVMELELDAEVPPEEVRQRLAQQAPAGLEILTARRIDGKTTAHVRRVSYRMAVPPDRWEGLPERAAVLLRQSACWIERRRPQLRRIDVKPYLCDLRLLPGALEMDLRVTPNGTARPEEILDLLGLRDLLEGGAVFERTKMELEDECSEVRGGMRARRVNPRGKKIAGGK